MTVENDAPILYSLSRLASKRSGRRRTHMHRQPKRIRRGAGDSMTDVGGDEEVVSGFQRERWLIGDLQNRVAFHKQHPFILGLIIPEALGTGLTMGVDALDFDACFLEECGEGFLGA